MILNVGAHVKDDKDNIYILDEIIGQGGFGCVFKSHREKDNAVFAVKTTLPSFGDSASVQSFKNEICSAAKVTGENVIHYEYVHDGDVLPEFPPYIIMEYADGGTLNTLLSKRKSIKKMYTNNELISIYKQLAKGMQQINYCLIHRDVKPDNILLCGSTLKISDFGLSKVATESTRTMSFKGCGTPLYMAPEAWDLTKNTVQMDIYSMGIVFYELATLQYPYTPSPTTYEECKSNHLYSATTNPTKINPNLSSSISSLIIRMLEKPVKNRFHDWNEIIELLDSQKNLDSPIDQIVAKAIAVKNEEDSVRQKKEYMLKQLAKEKKDFIRLVYSQIEQVIINPISDFVERVNLQYTGRNKLNFSDRQYHASDQTTFSWKLIIPPTNSVTIKFEAVYKKNDIPQYNGKNIIAWAEVINESRYGFNILLLDSGDIYGDWFLMKNKNNLSIMAGKERKEPFAFSLQELPKEIYKVQITHLYSSEFEEFNTTQFLKLIQLISFEL